MTGDEANNIIAEVGPLDDRIAGVARTDEGSWVAAIADVNVELELAEDGRRLVASALIAIPPEENETTIMRALLAFSMLWRETGFVHAAWAGKEQPAVLVANLAVEELTPKRLAGALANLADKVALWRELFFAEIGTEAAPAFDPMAFAGQPLIRI